MISTTSQLGTELLLICITIILVFIIGGLVMVWTKPPQWLVNQSPRRRYKIDKERVKDWKLRKKHPDVFEGDPPFNEIHKSEEPV